jgi:hypothetical protein
MTHGLQDELGPASWKGLSLSVREAYEKEGWFDKVLEKLNVRLALLDAYFAVPGPEIWSERVIPVFHTDDFLDYPWAHPMGGRSAFEIAHSWGINLDRFDDLLKAIDHGFRLYQSLGARAVKIGVAYRRSLLFEHASYDEANRAFDRLQEDLVEEARIALGNYTVRHILQRAAEVGLVVQVHTGYIFGHLDQGRPTNLVNLFLEYPQVKFVLFHGGYPYSDEAGLLAKTFPNVYLDMCWMPSLSQTMAQQILRRWIDLVPVNKIMWGGDVWSVEEFAGALGMFKDVLANALSGMMADGVMTEESALEFAHAIMHRNASMLFGLKLT